VSFWRLASEHFPELLSDHRELFSIRGGRDALDGLFVERDLSHYEMAEG